MRIAPLVFPALALCATLGHVSDARPCRGPAASRTQQPVFAVPVATVVVAVQPTVLYSYRAAAQPSQLAGRSAPPANPVVEVPTAPSVLRRHCFACHHGAAPRGGLSFFHDDGMLESLLPRRAIVEMASPNGDAPPQMPPGDAGKLTEDELKLLRDWAVPPRDLKY